MQLVWTFSFTVLIVALMPPAEPPSSLQLRSREEE